MRMKSCVCYIRLFLFFFTDKTAYELRIIDWSSYVCSSDLAVSAAPVTTCHYSRRYRTMGPALASFLSHTAKASGSWQADPRQRRSSQWLWRLRNGAPQSFHGRHAFAPGADADLPHYRWFAPNQLAQGHR